MTVRLTPAAREQLVRLLDDISQRDPLAAQKLSQRFTEVVSRLETFPLSGRTIPEYPDSAYREVITKPYRIFYTVKADTIWLVAFWHSAQIPGPP